MSCTMKIHESPPETSMLKLYHYQPKPSMSASTPVTVDLWQAPLADVYKQLECNATGLTAEEASGRLERFGPNRIAASRERQGMIMQVPVSFFLVNKLKPVNSCPTMDPFTNC
ncbi:hypothetical protein C8R43DRAFT_981583 [Mycena crocata]|nr:hypothetical protein C8R43DRAFT_981583 [Mycena crocata]